MPELFKKTSLAETSRHKRFACTRTLEGPADKDIAATCKQVERMVDLALGRMGLVHSSLGQLSEHDDHFRPGLRELTMSARFKQLQERKILDMGDAVSKAIDAIGAMQKNAKLMNALRTIREGKGDRTTVEILCKEFDALEEKILVG